MKHENLDWIVLAGLLHDIGKLFERGEVFSDQRRDPFYTEVCRRDRDGRISHLHAAHTLAFCDWLEERFDCLQADANRDWKRWCAGHHRDDETGPEHSVIRISDRLSSSEREEGDYYQARIHQRTLLEPVLERVFLEGHGAVGREYTTHRYPLSRLDSEREHLFPVPGEILGLKSMENPGAAVVNPGAWVHLVAEAPLKEGYAALCEGLMREIDALSRQCRTLPLKDLLVTLMTLLERYTANVPSATNLRHPDISLFDHLRTTAAIAQGLYLYQEHEARHHGKTFPVILPEKDDTVRWILACGDFSGIQKFIYNLTNKGAAKGLRGRSFYVGQFCRICADYLLRELGLSRAGLLYNSGGKFYLLIPAHLRASLCGLRDTINGWLMKEFGTEVFFGLGLAEVTAPMFARGGMHEAWAAAADDLELDRSRKFRGLLMKSDFFEPETAASDYHPTKSCEVCGSRRIDGDVTKCRRCDRLERLGSALRDAGAILTVWDEAEELASAGKTQEWSRHSFDFEGFGAACHILSEKAIETGVHGCLGGFDGELTLLNQWGDRPFSDLALPSCAVTTAYVGKWDPRRQMKDDPEHGRIPWSFDDYAEHAQGIKRIGILRMDVDNLGMVFIQGLSFPERADRGWGAVVEKNGIPQRKKMASISRMVTLSRQLNHFFSGYVPRLLEAEAFNQCQTIYAGGDDLFVIGSWHQLPSLAEKIREEFKAFCCGNPSFGISGGLTLHRGGYPIYKGAQLAGRGEHKAKELRQQWGLTKKTAVAPKDSFCFLDVPIVWEDFECAKEITAQLEREIEKNRGLLSYLSQTAANNKALVQTVSLKKGLGIPDAWRAIQYASWYWRTAYQLRRRYKDQDMRVVWVDAVYSDTINEKKATLPIYTWMELPLRWTHYLHR